jgi:hypothetical protein
MLLQILHAQLQAIGFKQIVRIQKDDVFSAGKFDTLIAGNVRAAD